MNGKYTGILFKFGSEYTICELVKENLLEINSKMVYLVKLNNSKSKWKITQSEVERCINSGQWKIQ